MTTTGTTTRLGELRDAVAGRECRTVLPALLEDRDQQPGDGGWSMTVRGHAAVFDRLSDDLGVPGLFTFREKVQRGAFRKALNDAQDVRLLINHDPSLVLARTQARTLELREDPRGLHVYADVGETSYARDLRVVMSRGEVDQMSFGFTVASDTWEETHAADGTTEVVRTITEIDRLFDVSVVTFPAYPQTDAQARDVVLRALHETYGPPIVETELAPEGAAVPDREDSPPAPATGAQDERHLRTAWRRPRLRLLEASQPHHSTVTK